MTKLNTELGSFVIKIFKDVNMSRATALVEAIGKFTICFSQLGGLQDVTVIFCLQTDELAFCRSAGEGVSEGATE